MSSLAQEAMQTSRIILWFRDDLRLHDNPTVHAAVTKVKAKQAAEVKLVKPCLHQAHTHLATTPMSAMLAYCLISTLWH